MADGTHAVAGPSSPATGSAAVKRNRTFTSIQALRAFAAVSVAFYHVYLVGNQYHSLGIESLSAVALPGSLGVNIFFVISGFIILSAHLKDVDQPDRLGNYISRRFTRIYPLYWILTIAYMTAAFAGMGAPEFTTSFSSMLSSFTLIRFRDYGPPPLQVAWTLFYEMHFYIFFAIFIFSRRLGMILFGFAVVAMAFSFISGYQFPLSIGSLWNLHFVVGALVFFISRKLVQVPYRISFLMLALGAALIVGFSVLVNYDTAKLKADETWLLLLAPACGLIVLGCVLLEDKFIVYTPKFVNFLGDASYSIYLTHLSAISFSFIVLRKLKMISKIPASITFPTVFLLSILSGVVVYLIVERPLQKLTRGRRHTVAAPQM